MYAEKLRPLVKDTITYLHNALKEGRSILVEGANAAMLDIDFGMSMKKKNNPHKNKTSKFSNYNFFFVVVVFFFEIDRMQEPIRM